MRVIGQDDSLPGGFAVLPGGLGFSGQRLIRRGEFAKLVRPPGVVGKNHITGRARGLYTIQAQGGRAVIPVFPLSLRRIVHKSRVGHGKTFDFIRHRGRLTQAAVGRNAERGHVLIRAGGQNIIAEAAIGAAGKQFQGHALAAGQRKVPQFGARRDHPVGVFVPEQQLAVMLDRHPLEALNLGGRADFYGELAEIVFSAHSQAGFLVFSGRRLNFGLRGIGAYVRLR